VGEWVHVVVSLGQQRVTIPQLNHRSFRAAQIELLSAGLQTGEVSSAYLPEFPVDIVLEQDPPGGSTNASTPHVDMLVSLGPQLPAYVMPGLEGLLLGDAEQRLSAAGLKVNKVTPLPLTGRLPGTVTSQLPARGARIEPGAGVELQVAQ
jgi:serine/threonine-protein kinase